MKLLLAEDDTGLRETLAEGLRAVGYDVVAVPNGQAALQALESTQFAAAVLDGLLPKQTGFDVAKQIRAKSPSTTVVLISGVFKGAAQQQEHLQATGAKAYLTKPFDLRRLVDTLRQHGPAPTPPADSTGAPAAPQQPLPAEGNLLESPVLFLGWRIHREQHTGVLELWGAAEKARIFAYRGRAVFAQHSDPMLHIGVELLKEGVISPEQYKQALDLAVQRGVGLYDVLRAENFASEAQMKTLYKGLVPRIVERCATMNGRFRWVATDAFTALVPAASTSLLDGLLTGVSRAQEKDLEPHVAPRRPLRLAPGEAWADVVPLLPQACGSDSLTRAINGRATIAQMLEVSPTVQERLARYRQVYVLMSTMAVRASLEPMAMTAPPPSATPPTPQAAPQPPPAAQPPPATGRPAAKSVIDANADAGIPFSADEQAARARIDAKYKEIDGKDFWTVLGVPRNVDGGTLKKAFYAASRDFHPDSFAGMKLGSAQKKLDHVFATIQEAYATLSDDAKRAEYEAKLNIEQSGGSSDVAAIFQAEGDFSRIKLLVERGELGGAMKLIDRVAAVLANNDEVKGYKVFLDWWSTKNAATAEKTVKDLAAFHKAHPSAHSLTEFQGWIYLEVGNLKLARAAFRRVLDVEPKHPGANRGLRATNLKIEEEQKASSGALGGLFKR